VTAGSVLSASNAVQTCSVVNDTLDDRSDRLRAAVFRLFFLFTAFLSQNYSTRLYTLGGALTLSIVSSRILRPYYYGYTL
jgi:hypothetical protein